MNKREYLSPKVRFNVLRRDAFRCTYCGHCPPEVKLQVDHVLPVAGGGTNQMFNLVTVCDRCNNGKKDSLLTEAERFAITTRAAENAVSSQPLVATDADEKRADEVVERISRRYRITDRFVARHVVLLCIRHGASWASEAAWADDCTSYRNWLDEQHRYLAAHTRPPGQGNLEEMGTA